MRYGYACINMELSYPRKFDKPRGTKKVTMSRSMIRRTFDAKGIAYASELSLQIVRDFLPILKWNVANDIHFFRVSSNVFPWASEYQIQDLPDYEEIERLCKEAGEYAKEHNIRITSHPGPFNKLASPDERVVNNTIRDLDIHGEFFDMIGLPRTPEAKINIHVGAAYGDKSTALSTFCRNFDKLPARVKSRLTVENDDRKSLYTTKELYEGVFVHVGCPIVFDYHHHSLHPGQETEKEALEIAVKTWGNIKPVVHYSESRSEEQNNPKIKPCAHSDLVVGPIDDHGFDLDVMIEAKHKELALKNLRGY